MATLKQTLIAGFAFFVQAGAALHAHDLPVSELKLVAGDDRLHLEIMLNAWELQFFNELDGDKNGLLDRQELDAREEQIARRVVDTLDIRIDNQLIAADVAGVVPDYNTHHLTIRAHYPVDARDAQMEVSSRLAAITNAAHVVKLTLRRTATTERATLSSSDSLASFPGLVRESPEESTASERDGQEAEDARSRLQSRIGTGLVLALAVGGVLLLSSRNS